MLNESESNLYDVSQFVQCNSNHSFNYWVKYMLQQYRGRFAMYPVFYFLVFNIFFQSTNRYINIVCIIKGFFDRLKRIYRRLTANHLKIVEKKM